MNERLGTEGAKYIDANKDHPFFLYAGHYAVHGPIQARAEVIAKYRQRDTGVINPTYCALVESMDAAVGHLLAAIDKAGIRDHTVIFFTADHGGLRFEGKAPKPVTTNAPLRAGKGHVFEGGVRIPLLISWPEVTKPSSVIDTPVCNVDWLPTVLKALDLPVSQSCRRDRRDAGTPGQDDCGAPALLALPALQSARRRSGGGSPRGRLEAH